MIVYEKEMHTNACKMDAKEIKSILNRWKTENKVIQINDIGPGLWIPGVYLKKYSSGKHTVDGIDKHWFRLFFGFYEKNPKYNFFIHVTRELYTGHFTDDIYKYCKTDTYETIDIITDNLHTEYSKHLIMQVKL